MHFVKAKATRKTLLFSHGGKAEKVKKKTKNACFFLPSHSRMWKRTTDVVADFGRYPMHVHCTTGFMEWNYTRAQNNLLALERLDPVIIFLLPGCVPNCEHT